MLIINIIFVAFKNRQNIIDGFFNLKIKKKFSDFRKKDHQKCSSASGYPELKSVGMYLIRHEKTYYDFSVKR